MLCVSVNDAHWQHVLWKWALDRSGVKDRTQLPVCPPPSTVGGWVDMEQTYSTTRKKKKTVENPFWLWGSLQMG